LIPLIDLKYHFDPDEEEESDINDAINSYKDIEDKNL
jgi:hypothetical protein